MRPDEIGARSFSAASDPVQYREPVFATERRRRILEHVRRHGTADLRELAEAVEASEVTVRRDLRALEERGLIARHRGGAAALPEQPAAEPQEETSSDPAVRPEHAAIAELAATLVQDGDAIAISAGATAQQLAARLADGRRLTVVTNSLLVGEVLGRSRDVSVVMTGGSLRGTTYGLVGSGAEQSFTDLRVRRAFLSGDGLTAGWGLSTGDLPEAGVDRAIADAAQEVVVLVDRTRLGADAPFQSVPVARIRHLVTDDGADPAFLDALRSAGVQVHVATAAPDASGPPSDPSPADV